MWSKILGTLMMIIGTIGIISGIQFPLGIFINKLDNIMILLYSIGFILIEFYGFYLIYSGWTRIKKQIIKKWIFIVGLLFGLIIIMSTLIFI